jgi:VWFA-related protein
LSTSGCLLIPPALPEPAYTGRGARTTVRLLFPLEGRIVPRSIRLTVATAMLCSAVLGAQGRPDGTPADGPIFRLTVDLVQLDAVVTDKKGRHVTTLGPEDFEVYQDGKPQPVVAASYVVTEETWIDTSGLPPLPPEAIRPIDARRVIAIVVDDSRMSFESVHHARVGLGEYLDRHFTPGDRAMVVTTSGGYGRVTPLTSDVEALKRTVKNLRFSLWNVQAASALEPLDSMFSPFDVEQQFRERTFALNAVLRVREAIRAVRMLPGRKSVVLVSEGFSVAGPGMDHALIREALQQLVDESNRAGVVIYALDPRGLVHIGLSAADARGMGPRGMASLARMRGAALRESQDGLRFVAGQTGGFAVVNSNDLALGLQRIMTDQRGYYLIGYQPEPGTIAVGRDQKFRRLKIRVKEKGLRVRTRAGFYARPTE